LIRQLVGAQGRASLAITIVVDVDREDVNHLINRFTSVIESGLSRISNMSGRVRLDPKGLVKIGESFFKYDIIIK